MGNNSRPSEGGREGRKAAEKRDCCFKQDFSSSWTSWQGEAQGDPQKMLIYFCVSFLGLLLIKSFRPQVPHSSPAPRLHLHGECSIDPEHQYNTWQSAGSADVVHASKVLLCAGRLKPCLHPRELSSGSNRVTLLLLAQPCFAFQLTSLQQKSVL